MNVFPPYLSVDIVGRCNLSCLYCPQGRGRNLQPQGLMSLDEFMADVGPILPQVRRLELFNWSEPFLHPQLIDIIAYVRQVSPGTRIRLSTNGTVRRKDITSGIVHHRVDSLTVTISGLSDEVHRIYHRGASLTRVLETVREVALEKEQQNSPLPTIRIRYLRFAYNFVSPSKVEAFLRRHFGSLTRYVDDVRVRDGFICELTLPDEELEQAYGVHLKQDGWQAVPLAGSCRLALENPVIRADGAVFPCCAVAYRDEYVLGHLRERSFEEVWQGRAYSQFRQRLLEGTNPVCNGCRMYFRKASVTADRYLLHRLRLRGKLSWQAARARRLKQRRRRQPRGI